MPKISGYNRVQEAEEEARDITDTAVKAYWDWNGTRETPFVLAPDVRITFTKGRFEMGKEPYLIQSRKNTSGAEWNTLQTATAFNEAREKAIESLRRLSKAARTRASYTLPQGWKQVEYGVEPAFVNESEGISVQAFKDRGEWNVMFDGRDSTQWVREIQSFDAVKERMMTMMKQVK